MAISITSDRQRPGKDATKRSEGMPHLSTPLRFGRTLGVGDEPVFEQARKSFKKNLSSLNILNIGFLSIPMRY